MINKNEENSKVTPRNSSLVTVELLKFHQVFSEDLQDVASLHLCCNELTRMTGSQRIFSQLSF